MIAKRLEHDKPLSQTGEINPGVPAWEVTYRFPSQVLSEFAMPAVYEKLGIRFQYPENWTLDEEDALEENPTVSVHSPNGGFWSVMIHPSVTSPEVLAEAALGAMRQQYEDLDSEAVEEQFGPHHLLGYDMNFICLDLTNSASVRSFRRKDASVVVLFQANDQDMDRIERVFRAITRSLLD